MRRLSSSSIENFLPPSSNTGSFQGQGNLPLRLIPLPNLSSNQFGIYPAANSFQFKYITGTTQPFTLPLPLGVPLRQFPQLVIFNPQSLPHAPISVPNPQSQNTVPVPKNQGFRSSSERNRREGNNGVKRRNVYKAIIRRMHNYTRKNSVRLMQTLRESGFTREEAEHAFFVVGSLYGDMRDKGKCKFLATLKGMARKKSIYTYILRETLSAMMSGWQNGKRGRILLKNYGIYKRICKIYYDEVVRVISGADC
eukprot:TRINITY_DN13799_c0_g2_i3.p1 TRINITY_DN13799_c0_g2~~TRINITY_DN13799_c0_g2_i3.p1  ORF type:complete len:253 (-),score=18.16 TRINITY_DN13799_c0_g2_i3:119-877(-)